ncbi:MAG: hypothetical protein AAGL29_14365 [Bacteroidota bacterium]
MNKSFTIVLIVFALALIAYNVTMVDFNNPFQGDSTIALIGIVASLCAIILLLIFMTSKKIKDKLEEED